MNLLSWESVLVSPLPARWGNHSSAKDGLPSLPGVLACISEGLAPGFSSKWAFRTRALGDLWPRSEGWSLGRIQSLDSSCWPSRAWEWIVHLPTLSLWRPVWVEVVLTLRMSASDLGLIILSTIFYPAKTERQTAAKCDNMVIFSHWRGEEAGMLSLQPAGPYWHPARHNTGKVSHHQHHCGCSLLTGLWSTHQAVLGSQFHQSCTVQVSAGQCQCRYILCRFISWVE